MKQYSQFTDSALFILLNKGDQVAYTEIFERYKVVLYQHAYRILQDEDESNDVLQDIFLALWQKRENIALNTSLSAYLYSAVRNKIFDIIAHQKVITKYLDSIKAHIDKGEFITDEKIRAKELAGIIEASIDKLPAKMRRIFELSRQEELSYKDIGHMLHLSDKTVKQQVYNAIKILRRKIENYILLTLFF